MGRRRKMTVQGAIERYWTEHAQHLAAAASVRPMLERIADQLGPLSPLDGVDNNAIARYLAIRKTQKTNRGRAPSNQTLRHELNHICAIVARAREIWNVSTGDLVRARFMAQTRPRPPAEVFLTYEQAFAFVDAIIPHARPAVRFALLTGMRKSNVMGLEWPQIAMGGQYLLTMAKGGQKIRVDLVPEAVELLTELWPDPRSRTGHVFVYGNPAVDCPCAWCSHESMARYRDGRHIIDISRAYNTARKAIGIPRLRFHDLRHTVASWVLAQGNLKLAQQVLKHRNISSTMRYAHLEAGAEMDVMQRALTTRAA